MKPIDYLPPGTFSPTVVGKSFASAGASDIKGGTIAQPSTGSAGVAIEPGSGLSLAPKFMQKIRVRAERNATTGRLSSTVSADGDFIYIEQITPIFPAATDVGVCKAIIIQPDTGPALKIESAPHALTFAQPFTYFQIDSEPGVNSCYIDLVVGFGRYADPYPQQRAEPFWSRQTITRPANIIAYAANQIVGPQPAGAGYDLMFQNVFGAGRRYARITRARIEKSSLTITAADFVLHLWQGNAGSGLASTADQAAFTLKSNPSFSYLGPIRFPNFYTGGAGSNISVCELNGLDLSIMNPDDLYLGLPLGPYSNLYGILETQAAYAPASGETFTVEIFGQRF